MHNPIYRLADSARAGGRRISRKPGAAVLFDEVQGLVDCRLVGSASHDPPFLPLIDEPRRHQPAKMKRKS